LADTIRVILADDHPLVRSGIRATLSTDSRVEVVGEATNSHEVRVMCTSLNPDVLLLDLNMPGQRPVDTVTFLRHECPDLKVIVLTAYDDDAYVRGLLAAGVAGYVLKDEAPETVIKAVLTVMNGGTWFSQTIVQGLIQHSANMVDSIDHPVLSERDRQVLSMLARGWDNVRISTELTLAEQTVRNYISRIYSKLGLTSRGEAIIWAREHMLDEGYPPNIKP
jgi:DNA-binding NarL/FixJ family response regulator